jgi:uncharacterized membrane protein YjgN (DUF898 family)
MADTCPKCGRTAVDSDKCPGCGVIVPLYLSYLERVRRGPTAPGTATSALPPASVVRATPAVVGDGPTTARSTPDGDRPARAAAPSTGTRRVAFHGTGRELFGVHIVNMFLTLLTFGIYYFWAKTRIRRYLYAATEIEQDRFAYHGTGRELLIGFAKALVVFLLPIMALQSVPQLVGADPAIQGIAGLLGSILAGIFGAVAIVGARRYRLSRTSWRGIRFSLRCELKEFIKLFYTWGILMGLTFGLYYPVFLVRKYGYLTDHSYFGSARFAFDGDPKGLFKPFLKLIGLGLLTLVAFPLAAIAGPVGLLLILTVGIGLAWAVFAFLAEKRRYFWNHTTLDGAAFDCTVTAGGLAKLYLVNALLLVVTLGLAVPWVKVRNASYACAHLTLSGPLDLAAIRQQAMDARATGEALSGILGGDLELG